MKLTACDLKKKPECTGSILFGKNVTIIECFSRPGPDLPYVYAHLEADIRKVVKCLQAIIQEFQMSICFWLKKMLSLKFVK